MKNLKKISRENLKSISGGIYTQPPSVWCPLGKEPVKCVDPDTGAISWQCITNGNAMLCVRVIPV